MREPVLVIHGVANRNRAQFLQLVQQFNQSISLDFEFLPVYWGDLAAREALVRDTLPLTGRPDTDAVGRVARTAVPDAPDLAASLFLELTQRAIKGRRKENADLILKSALAALPLRTESSTGAGSPVVRTARGVSASARRRQDPRSHVLQEAIREELPKTRFLQHIQTPETLEMVGKLLGQAMPDGNQSTEAPVSGDAEMDNPIQRAAIRTPAAVRALKENIDANIAQLKQFASERIHDLDAMVGGVMDTAMARVNHVLRDKLLPGFTRLLGDIFVYQRRQAEIQQRFWRAIHTFEQKTDTSGWGTQERPISVLAHSLGGVIAFDAAVSGSPRLWIRQFVTFGSQPAFFHVLDPRAGLTEYRPGAPVILPPSIGHWTSFWEPMDMLAFLAGAVFLLSDEKTPPRDLEVRVIEASELASSFLWTHSSYWTLDPVIREIRNVLTHPSYSRGPL